MHFLFGGQKRQWKSFPVLSKVQTLLRNIWHWQENLVPPSLSLACGVTQKEVEKCSCCAAALPLCPHRCFLCVRKKQITWSPLALPVQGWVDGHSGMELGSLNCYECKCLKNRLLKLFYFSPEIQKAVIKNTGSWGLAKGGNPSFIQRKNAAVLGGARDAPGRSSRVQSHSSLQQVCCTSRHSSRLLSS